MSEIYRPGHYNSGDIECIDAIEACCTPDQFTGTLRGNVLKYIWRYDKKGSPVADLRKARWYLDRLILNVFEVAGASDEERVD